MICQNCGRELSDLMRFCPACGAKREETTEFAAEATGKPETERTEETAAAEENGVPAAAEENAEERREEIKRTAEETLEAAGVQGPADAEPEEDVLPEEEKGSAPSEEASEGTSEEALEEPSEETSDEPVEETLEETRENGGDETSPVSRGENEENEASGEEAVKDAAEEAPAGMPTPLPLTRLRASIGEQAGEKAEENGAPGLRAGLGEAKDKLLAVAGSGFMLLLCIVLSLQIALSLVASLAVTAEILREFFEGNSVTVRSAASPSLIEIATAVLLWIVYARARKSPPKTSGGVMKALRVFAIVKTVFTGIAAGTVLLAGLAVTLVPQLFGLYRYGSGIPGVNLARFSALLGVSLFLTLPILILMMVYQIMLTRYYGGVIDALAGPAKPIGTGFLRVWCWIGIVVNALGALGGAALLGAGKYVVYGMTDVLGYRLTPESESAFVTAVIAFAAVTIVSSLAACLMNFAKERLFRNSSRAVRESSGPETV